MRFPWRSRGTYLEPTVSRFPIYVERVLGSEGGYVNLPQDPGGETNWGIAKRSYPNEDIKALTREAAIAIYKRDFWDRIHGDDLPPAVAFQVLDAAVNHGIGNALRWMQEAAGVAPDGNWGPITKTAVLSANSSDLVLRFNAVRIEFYCKLSTFPAFGKGWMRRVAGNLRVAAEDN
jgi:lysozyme family protein